MWSQYQIGVNTSSCLASVSSIPLGLLPLVLAASAGSFAVLISRSLLWRERQQDSSTIYQQGLSLVPMFSLFLFFSFSPFLFFPTLPSAWLGHPTQSFRLHSQPTPLRHKNQSPRGCHALIISPFAFPRVSLQSRTMVCERFLHVALLS